MKYYKLYIFLVIFMVFSACDNGSCNENNNNNSNNNSVKHPFLRVVNQSSLSIRSVGLVGYDFTNLNITNGNSQTFVLDKGMPGGYSGINIIVEYGASSIWRWQSNNFNFDDGKTTTITLRGNAFEEYRLE